nr:unnamed protein product [Callosobruchus analis]
MDKIPQPFLIILRLFGVYPLQKPVYKCYVVVLVTASAFSFISATKMKDNDMFTKNRDLVKLSDEVFTILLTITSIACNLYIIFLYPSRLQGILEDLNMFETTIDAKCSFGGFKFWILFILFVSTYIAATVFETVIWLEVSEFKFYKYYVGRNVQIIQVDMVILLEMLLCLELWSRYKALNEDLRLFSKHSCLGASVQNIFNAIKELDEDEATVEWRVLKIMKLKKLHNLLCDTVQSFNVVFGPVMLLETLSAISLIAEYTLVFAYYLVIHHRPHTPVVTLLVDGLLYIIPSAIKLFGLAAVGQLVYGEAYDTIAISYRSIAVLETTDQLGHHLIKKELLDLIKQVHIRKPKVAASSFFDVNFGMTGFVVSTMTVKIEHSSFCYLKPFVVLLRLFGMFPCSGKSKRHKAYVIVLVIATSFGYVISTVAKESWLFLSYLKVMKFVDQTYNASLFIVCVVSQVFMVFLYLEKIQDLLHAISITDSIKDKRMSSKCLFWISFCVCSFCTILILSVDTAIWIYTVGFDRYKYYTLRNIQYYQANMLLLFETWLCLEQKLRFRHLNDQLKSMLERFIAADLQVKSIKKSHNHLCNIAESFSEIFGTLIVLQVIFLISIVISYTLNALHYLLVLNEEMVKVFYNFGSDRRVTAIGAIFMFSNLAKLFALAGVGELFYQEAHKATGICYDSINELEVNSQLASDVIKDQLLAFVQQVRDRNPKIAASSCFDVRLGMIGFVIASVTSYIIVAVQFMVQ